MTLDSLPFLFFFLLYIKSLHAPARRPLRVHFVHVFRNRSLHFYMTPSLAPIEMEGKGGYIAERKNYIPSKVKIIVPSELGVEILFFFFVVVPPLCDAVATTTTTTDNLVIGRSCQTLVISRVYNW